MLTLKMLVIFNNISNLNFTFDALTFGLLSTVNRAIKPEQIYQRSRQSYNNISIWLKMYIMLAGSYYVL